MRPMAGRTLTTLDTSSYDPAGEVVELCRDLIRFDTSNYGDDEGPGERKAAEHVAALLDEVGIAARVVEAEPGRTNVIAQWGGTSRGGDGLLLHGHLDVVPAAAEDWQVHPFSGEIRDGFVWGRGAIDMKDFDAMVLSVVRARTRAGAVPERPITLVLHRRRGGRRAPRRPASRRGPRRRAGALHRGGRRGRRVQHQRPRPAPLPRRGGREGDGVGRLTARGRAGHGSMINRDNAITALAAAVARIGAHEWPVRLTPTMRTLLAAVAELAGTEATPENAEALVEEFGDAAADDRRGPPQHPQPDHARGRLQGERDPDGGHRPRGRPLPARLRGRVLGDPSPSSAARTSPTRPCPTSRRGRRRTTVTLVDAMTRSLARRGPGRAGRAVPA